MMRRLLCALGWHDWCLTRIMGSLTPGFGVKTSHCSGCRKTKVEIV